MHEKPACVIRKSLGGIHAVVDCALQGMHLSAERRHSLDLGDRGVLGHEDGAGDSLRSGGVGKGLTMVPGTAGDHARTVIRTAASQLCRGAPQLEGPGPLHALSLNGDLPAVLMRQRPESEHRSLPDKTSRGGGYPPELLEIRTPALSCHISTV